MDGNRRVGPAPVGISIVTPTYNQADTIGETFRSVLAQKIGPSLEYIVVDGCSTDGTREKVQAHAPEFEKSGIRFHYIREPDGGQADAVNKGWRFSKGEVLGFLNSDDLLTPGAVRRVLDYFTANRHVQWAYGGWHLIGAGGQVYKTVSHRRFRRSRLLDYCNIGQPSCYFRRPLLAQFGGLDKDLHLAMDYDLWLRFSARYPAGIIPHVLSAMRYHTGAKSADQTGRQLREILQVGMRHTRAGSFQRLRQYFFYLRGLAVVFAGADITRRIAFAQGSRYGRQGGRPF
jgi:glycosyltransferase involved in cell wall biosynthesis